MKREMEIIRSILLALEDGQDPDVVEGATEDQVKYHQALLIESRLIDGVVSFYIETPLKFQMPYILKS